MVNLDYAWFFLIYAFIGWCVEVVYAAVESGHFVNRGFLNGPVCPIYGVGVLTVIWLLQPVEDNIFLMFAGAVIITSTVEFLGGFILEKIFHDRWWDYSDMPFNIGGYICLMFSLAWGLACLVVVDRIHPLITTLVNGLPLALSQALLIIFGMVLLIDVIATVKSVLNLNHRLEVIDELSLRIREASELFGENLASGALAAVRTGAELEENLEAQIALMEARREWLEERLEERLEAQKASLENELAEIRMLPRKARDYQKETLLRQKQALQELLQSCRDLRETSRFGHARLIKAFPGMQSLHHSETLDKLRKAVTQGFINAGLIIAAGLKTAGDNMASGAKKPIGGETGADGEVAAGRSDDAGAF